MYAEEFHESAVLEHRQEALRSYREKMDVKSVSLADIGERSGERLCALLRAVEPDTIVETVVANVVERDVPILSQQPAPEVLILTVA